MTQQELEFVERLLLSNAALRSENYQLRCAALDLFDPEMYAHAVSQEVRERFKPILYGEKQ